MSRSRAQIERNRKRSQRSRHREKGKTLVGPAGWTSSGATLFSRLHSHFPRRPERFPGKVEPRTVRILSICGISITPGSANLVRKWPPTLFAHCSLYLSSPQFSPNSEKRDRFARFCQLRRESRNVARFPERSVIIYSKFRV